MEVVVYVILAIVYIALIVLSGFFIYWQANFLNEVPRILKNIEEAIEKVAEK